MTNKNIYMLLRRDGEEDIPKWVAVEYFEKAKEAFDVVRSCAIPHKMGDIFTIISIDYASDITEKARFLWVSDGEKIVRAPQTHIFMGDKTWLQFWEGADSTAENMFQACSAIDRRVISMASCDCARISFGIISRKNIDWARESLRCVLSGRDIEKMISIGNEIMADSSSFEYEAIYAVIKSLNTVNSMSPHYEAHVAAINAASASGHQEDAFREMAAIIRSHIPLRDLILATINYT